MSIDEAFIDITGCEKLFGSPLEIAQAIQKEIYDRLQLTCSLGVAPNKFLAKLCSEHRKPNGITVLTPDRVDEFLLPLDISKIWGVGEK